MSCLQAFLQASPTNTRIVRVLKKYNHLKPRGKDIIFFWISSHVGIKGSKESDGAAKEALSLNQASKTILAYWLRIWEIRLSDISLLQEEWQRKKESESDMNNKLKRVFPKLNENHTLKGMTRRDGSICARLCIGQ